MVMNKWARVENLTVVEITHADPRDRFHPSLIWVPCPANTVTGMKHVDGRFTEPPALVVDHAAQIAAVRYQKETAGITLDGVHIDTGRESQALITAAALSAVIDPAYACTWKAISGPVELSAAQLIGIATAVRMHVQACFDRECELLLALDEGLYTPNLLGQGWPAAQGT